MRDTMDADVTVNQPLYQVVRQHILHCLISEEWKPGEALPSETRLAQRFSVSVGTIRKAIDELVQENILVRHQGRGTFVTTHNRNRSIYHFFLLTRNDGTRELPTSEFFALRRNKADQETASHLHLQRGAAIYRHQFAYWLGGERTAVCDTRLPVALFPNLRKEMFIDRKSMTMYGMYQTVYGVNVLYTNEYLRAVAASEEVANLLDLPPQAPVLQLDRVAYTYQDQPVEFRRSFVKTEHFYYFNSKQK